MSSSGAARRRWPYHAPGFLRFTDAYGHDGSVVHPDVVDTGPAGWNGHRYWMACTPYYRNDYRQENPSVYWADTPTEWVEATTNPVYPPPAKTSRWNSDPDLVLDPDTGEMALLFRDGRFTPHVARSADGVTWPASPSALRLPGVKEEMVSPSLLRVGSEWWLWGIAHPSRVMYRWTAPRIEGPWKGPVTCTGWNADAWHFNMVEHGGRLLCLMHEGWTTGTAFAASSSDGVVWSKNPRPILVTGRADTWDSLELYRSAMTVHENGTTMRVWYPGRSDTSDSWRLGYTEIPLSEWPA